VRAVVFDIGETLVDETKMWERAADAAGVPRFTLMGVLGGLAARGEHHDHAWELLGVTKPDSSWEPADFYPDALPCIEALIARGLRVGAVGNTPRKTEELLGRYIDVLGSSESWGVSNLTRSSSGASSKHWSFSRARSPTLEIASTTTCGPQSVRGCWRFTSTAGHGAISSPEPRMLISK
jgi:hypothetical protein